MKKVAILTSGGDAPGMNAAIRAVTRYAIYNDFEVYGVYRGYTGLINGDIVQFTKRSVSDIIQRGGTMLKTSRCPEFNTMEGQQRAYDNLQAYGIDSLVVIGGDGSFRGAMDLYKNFGVKTIGIPGTIDNDLAYTDYTLGFDTAVNTVIGAINNLRDTMTAHERVNILEVMGRRCGDIAVYAGISGGAEVIVVPEIEYDIERIAKTLMNNNAKGKNSNIIIVAEGVMPAAQLMEQIKQYAKLSIRTTVLGHIQRGGAPTMADRVLAARLSVGAIEAILAGKGGRVIGIRDNEIIDQDIIEALSMPRVFNQKLYDIAKILSL